MSFMIKKQNDIDDDTKQYIWRIRKIQICVFFFILTAFLILVYGVVRKSGQSLQAVALAEFEQEMREDVDNTIIQIENVRERCRKEMKIHMEELADRMQKNGASDVASVRSCLEVSAENALGLKTEAVCQTEDGAVYALRANTSEETEITVKEKEALCEEAVVLKRLNIDGMEVILLARQDAIDEVAKEEIYEYIHSQVYIGNQYVWVNEVIHMEGGDNYAIRRIHPNMTETEGEYLSTFTPDIEGNYPYQIELDGIREDGEVFQSYYFKNKLDDKITEKFSYARYYEPFRWIVATGETLDEVYEYAVDLDKYSFRYILELTVILILGLALLFGMVLKIIGDQAMIFKKKMRKQTELTEKIYTALAVGLLRLRITEEESTILKINPKGLEMFGVENMEELLDENKKCRFRTMDEKTSAALNHTHERLEKLWDSCITECQVMWKDGTVHLLSIRDTLVEMEENAKIIQRLCQDITEERKKYEHELLQAEEKVSLDPMTQIKNKKAIEQLIQSYVEEAAKKELPVAVGFVDIDNFRDYNTKYGHLQGDEVIKYVAHTLSDTINGVVGRNGGDEFAFCMLNPKAGELEAAMQSIYEKLNEGIFLLETGERTATPCSIGVVLAEGSDLCYSDLIEQSDKAMYLAKEKGKNTYCILKG